MRHSLAILALLGLVVSGVVPADATPRRRSATVELRTRSPRLSPPPAATLHGTAKLGNWFAKLVKQYDVAARDSVAHGPLVVGMPTRFLELRAAPGSWGRQRKSQWCWAASSQIILNYIGLPLTQEAIIGRAFGTDLDQPASVLEIAATLNGWTISDSFGRQFTVITSAFATLPAERVIADLAAQRPPIVGLINPNGNGGHAFVLTAVSYDLDPQGLPSIKSVVLRDPWPDNPSRVEMSMTEFQRRVRGGSTMRSAGAVRLRGDAPS
jgi:hypothetical protein